MLSGFIDALGRARGFISSQTRPRVNNSSSLNLDTDARWYLPSLNNKTRTEWVINSPAGAETPETRTERGTERGDP